VRRGDWIVGIDPSDFGDDQGYIVRRRAPEFVAKWTIEDEDFATLSDLVYTDADEEVAIALYDFEFVDEKPEETLFRRVCAEGVEAIDLALHSWAGAKAEYEDMA